MYFWRLFGVKNLFRLKLVPFDLNKKTDKKVQITLENVNVAKFFWHTAKYKVLYFYPPNLSFFFVYTVIWYNVDSTWERWYIEWTKCNQQ